ncbi:VCBS repeat-containing protein [Fibrella sp. HMF5335]|uniref:VCBS repeat-containing protein n=1 Tax=Fibrella rubiginis TaxID=2817060 RepID=A0A939K687_9BACT|nr:VCBS repeat-containing protein [Fibrella rubiginis]MBO0938588.1 VCBS repeat-containing protein [Fibrella rubiginis]
MFLRAFLCFIGLTLVACHNNTPSDARFTRIGIGESGMAFNNEMQRFESDSLNAHTYDPMYNGAGVGIGDFNQDGLQDVFFAANNVTSRLYLNRIKPGNNAFTFEDVTDRARVQTHKWCTGVSIADVNQDGWPDIYVCVSGPGVDKWESNPDKFRNLLFINQQCKPGGVPTFREEAHAYGLDVAGMNTQAAFFDYDRDGDLDCYVLRNALERQGRNAIRPKKTDGTGPSNDVLLENKGGKERREEGSGPPLRNGGKTAVFLSSPPQRRTAPFLSSSLKEGITTEGYGLGLTIADINRDGWPDIYCANDFVSNDLVWINQHENGKHTGFRDEAASLFKHTSFNSMGVDIQDVNNDALPDVMVVDMLPDANERQKMMLMKTSWDYFRLARQQGYQDEYVRNVLQLNTGGQFSEIGQLAGVFRTDWSWAPLLQDYDNDGRKDLFITNGYRRDITNLDYVMYLNEQFQGFGIKNANIRRETLKKLYDLPEVKLHNYFFRNTNGDPATPPVFADVSEAWGLGEANFSNGAAYADFDNDGDLDLVINNMDSPAGLYRNETIQTGQPTDTSDRNTSDRKISGQGITERTNHSLRLRLPTDAHGLGATVLVSGNNGQMQSVEAHPVRGYMSSVDPTVLVGMGKQTVADVTIRWANGTEQHLGNLPADQLHTITYNPSTPATTHNPGPTPASLFTTADATGNGLLFRHVEAVYNDFQDTPMLPQQYSRNSPAIAVGDVNGDGLADVFVGADPGQTRKVYLQKPGGQFTEIVQGANALEDMGCTFFDADNDGDQDLYVVSGGSGHPDGDAAYQDRLYLNDGAGHFTRAPGALPVTRSSGGCVVAGDFDKDGDLDVFRSGRVCVGDYPTPPANYLLRNDSQKGQTPHFTDVTDQLAPGLRLVGMTCAALFTDVDNDTWPDLLLAGEFMPITLFRNQKGHFTRQSDTSAPLAAGLWSSLAAADLDHDGDMDYVAGNLGLNSRFKASATEPLRVYGADFDKNGKTDPMLTYYLQGKEHMASIRDALNEQMTTLSRKRFPTYQSYAAKSVAEAFDNDELAGAIKLEANELQSCWLENLGDGKLVMHPLPVAAQVSPVMGIQPTDIDHDGYPDLILVGNFYGPETYTGRYDASRGVVLLNRGQKGSSANRFQAVPPTRTGLAIDGDAKAIATLPVGAANWFLVTNNDGPVQLIRPK